MMKPRFYLFALLLAFTTALTAQDNQMNSAGKKIGYWKKYNDKGQLVYEGNFKNDVPVGEFTYYHTNGKVKSITYFIEGTHIVRTTLFDVNGKKSAEGKFFDQDKDSTWNYYNPKGTLICTENYSKGVKQGTWSLYSSETGTLLEEKNYENDKLSGTCRTFFADGKISSRIDYVNGKMNGLVEEYYPGEKIHLRGYYHQNYKVKNWDTYDADGRIRKTQEYNNSRIQRTYLYIYTGSVGQKVNQENIAYFHKEGKQTRIFAKNGKSFTTTDPFETAIEFLDFVDFCLINPSYAVAYPNIIKYRPIDENSIEVVLSPATEDPVICEGDQAIQVKMLFNTEIPKEEK